MVLMVSFHFLKWLTSAIGPVADCLHLATSHEMLT